MVVAVVVLEGGVIILINRLSICNEHSSSKGQQVTKKKEKVKCSRQKDTEPACFALLYDARFTQTGAYDLATAYVVVLTWRIISGGQPLDPMQKYLQRAIKRARQGGSCTAKKVFKSLALFRRLHMIYSPNP